MLPNEPTGSRAQRSSGRTNSSRIPSRGGIHKHNNTKPRMDRDGDLIMGAASATRGAGGSGRGGRNSRRGSSDLRGSKHHNTRIDPQVVQQVIAQGLGSRGPNRGPGRAIRSGRKPAPIHDTKENLDEISVLGLEKSLAASNPGGGVSELIAWLEQKASKSASEGEKVMITKVCLVLHATRSKRQVNFRHSGPLSLQAKLSERRPRYYATATG